MISARTIYYTDKYRNLCFSHAVKMVIKGEEVHSLVKAIEDDPDDSYSGFLQEEQCEICERKAKRRRI